MNNTALIFPAKYAALAEDETPYISGGSAIGKAWNVAVGTATGLASAAGDVFGSVIRGEISPLSALCSSFVYLAGNVVASIIWLIA